MLYFSPDQNAEVLVDYVDQLNVGRDIPIQTVAYDCANHITNVSSPTLRTNICELLDEVDLCSTANYIYSLFLFLADNEEIGRKFRW